MFRVSVPPNESPDLAHMRASYAHEPPISAPEGPDLDPGWLAQGWLALLLRWFAEAADFTAADGGRVVEPNAMVLGTVTEDGRPVTRTVLCKGADEDGVYFFTNYTSAKAGQLAVNPRAAATFPWYQMHRQVHVRGVVEKVSRAETLEYWRTRPRGSQLGAWASHQSRPVASREALVAEYARVEAEFAGVDPVPLPEFWGGYRLRPDEVEFWQGRPDRLHNRVRARLVAGGWLIERLQP